MKAAELRERAEEWLVRTYPRCVVVHELSVADWGGARIDVAAITQTHIVGVEVKCEGDSPARLPRQGLAYGMVAREMWLLPCPSLAGRCRKHRPKGWGTLVLVDDQVQPENARTVWDPKSGKSFPDPEHYAPSKASKTGHLSPRAMCGTLWRDELYRIARRERLDVGSRVTVEQLTSELERVFPAPRIHDFMIEALRQRQWPYGKRVVKPQHQETPNDQ